jgi:hypothetical protein
LTGDPSAFTTPETLRRIDRTRCPRRSGDLRAEGPGDRPTGEGRTCRNPRAPSVVSGPRKLAPAGWLRAEPCERFAQPRTVSPSLHPCPASGSASGFLPASVLSLHEALRPPGADDARCVQPTSATRTSDVHPLAVRSRLARTAFAIRDAPRRSVVVTRHDRGTGRFHDARDRFDLIASERVTPCLLPRGVRSRAWACSTRGARWDETSDTSVTNPSFSSRSRTFVRAATTLVVGRKSEEPAEATVAAGS